MACDRTRCKRGCIQVTSGMRGFFAVHMVPCEEGFCEPWQSGIESYKDSQSCYRGEAKAWAEAEQLPLL